MLVDFSLEKEDGGEEMAIYDENECVSICINWCLVRRSVRLILEINRRRFLRRTGKKVWWLLMPLW